MKVFCFYQPPLSISNPIVCCGLFQHDWSIIYAGQVRENIQLITIIVAFSLFDCFFTLQTTHLYKEVVYVCPAKTSMETSR